MPIKQVTSNLIRAGHIKLGTKKTGDKPGRNSEIFRIQLDAGQPDGTMERIEERFGKNPTELKIYFPKIYENSTKSRYWAADDQYEAWGNKKIACRGDGEKAERKANINESTGKIESWNNEWTEVECPCPLINIKGKPCSQIGRLRVGLHGLPFTGFFEITTHSWHAIRGLRAIIDMYYMLLKDDFFRTPFILYKEQKMLKGYNQYIVGIKPDPDFVRDLPNVDSMEFSLDGEDDDEAIIEIPEGFDSTEAEEAPKQQTRRSSGKNKAAEDQPNGDSVGEVGQSAGSNDEPEAQSENEADLPFTPDPDEPIEGSAKAAAPLEEPVQELSDEDALNEAYRIAELENPLEVIDRLTSKDGKILLILADNDQVPLEDVNKFSQEKMETLMDQEIVETNEPGEIKPETLEVDYGFERAKELVSQSEDINFVKAVADMGSGRLKITAKRRLTELQKKEDAPVTPPASGQQVNAQSTAKNTTTQTTQQKAQAKESNAQQTAKKTSATTTTATKEGQTDPVKNVENPVTSSASASTASPSKRSGMDKLREDKLKIAVSEYKGKGNFPESIDALIERFAGKKLEDLTTEEMVSQMKKFKEAVEATPFKPLDE